jgi:hypothetical protein
MKGSGWFLNPPPSSFVPFTFTFPFLSQLSVCLCVSRVRAYLTTNQQHGIPCLFKQRPLPDWPVWTRAQMEGSAAARGERTSGEGSSGKIEEEAPRVPKSDYALGEQSEAIRKRWEKHLVNCGVEGFSDRRSPEALDESAPALRSTIMAEKPGDQETTYDESSEYKGRDPLPTIMTRRSGETEPSLEEKVRLIKVTMSARAQSISVLEIGAPTTQVEPPQGAGKTPSENEAPNMAGGRPQTTLFPYKKKKKKIKPLLVENLIIVGDQLGQRPEC